LTGSAKVSRSLMTMIKRLASGSYQRTIVVVIRDGRALGENTHCDRQDATPTHVTVLFDGGGKRLKRQDLPAELKALYPYDAKAAEEYEKQHEKQKGEERLRQEQDNIIRLQRQKTAVQGRIDGLQKDLNQLEKELGPLKRKARGRPRSAERKELNAALDKKQLLIRSIGELQKQLDGINKQLNRRL
jgi:hypothetical protein